MCQQQIRTLVRCRPSGESDGEHVIAQADPSTLLDSSQQGSLGRLMGLPDTLQRYSDGVAEVTIVVPPSRRVAVVQLGKGRSDPCGGVHAVGYGLDGILGEHSDRDLSMRHRDAVDIPRETQRHVGHVQYAVQQTPRRLELGHALGTQHVHGQIAGKLVMAGGHRRVGREHAPLPDRLDLLVGNRSAAGLGQPILQQGQGEEA